ncbi:hypothetical protein Pelo_9875 [Pelomyxa schiedti]|nr:hypothetical protein Pelo_9875 [Pelomyxa schiedti]
MGEMLALLRSIVPLLVQRHTADSEASRGSKELSSSASRAAATPNLARTAHRDNAEERPPTWSLELEFPNTPVTTITMEWVNDDSKEKLTLPKFNPDKMDVRQWISRVRLAIRTFSERQIVLAIYAALEGEAAQLVIPTEDAGRLDSILTTLVSSFDTGSLKEAELALDNFKMEKGESWSNMVCRFRRLATTAAGVTGTNVPMNDHSLIRDFKKWLPADWVTGSTQMLLGCGGSVNPLD